MELLAFIVRGDVHPRAVRERMVDADVAAEMECVAGRDDDPGARPPTDVQAAAIVQVAVIVVAQQRVADGQVTLDPRGAAAETEAFHPHVAADPKARRPVGAGLHQHGVGRWRSPVITIATSVSPSPSAAVAS